MKLKLYVSAFVLGTALSSAAFAQTSAGDRAAPPNTGATTPGGASVGTMNAGNNPQANAADERRADRPAPRADKPAARKDKAVRTDQPGSRN